MMQRASARPPRIAQITDRILRWLIPGVVVLAVATFEAWWILVGFSKALYVALSVVLVTFPCALGIAIPLTLTSALERAGRHHPVSVGYNAIGLGLAVAGLLHPIAAVVIMTGSSLLVTGNAFRLKRGDSPGTERERSAPDRK